MTAKGSLIVQIRKEYDYKPAGNKKITWHYMLTNHQYYLMLFPCVVFFFLFKYIPMYGVLLAFEDFSFRKGIIGSPWIGFTNFEYLFGLSKFYAVLRNSFVLSFIRIIFCFPVPILLALMLNEMRTLRFKRMMQTSLYLPNFISWVVVGGILVNFLSPSWGIVNNIIKSLGGEPVFFLGDDRYFRSIVVLSSIWKNAGWDAILYLAAIAGVNPELYEAAMIDGANRFQRIRHVTLPGIKSTISILFILRMGGMLANGFEQIFMLQNGNNLLVSEVFETYTYTLGLLGGRYSFATTVGLFTSVINLVFLIGTNWIVKHTGEDGVW
jgi:putative aldouronate transport system permease protein